MACYGAASARAGAVFAAPFASPPRCMAEAARLARIFCTRYVGAIHGGLLTAWSTAGIAGPVIGNYLHDMRVAGDVPGDRAYALAVLSAGEVQTIIFSTGR